MTNSKTKVLIAATVLGTLAVCGGLNSDSSKQQINRWMKEKGRVERTISFPNATANIAATAKMSAIQKTDEKGTKMKTEKNENKNAQLKVKEAKKAKDGNGNWFGTGLAMVLLPVIGFFGILAFDGFLQRGDND